MNIESKKKEIMLNGVKYSSVIAASKATGIGKDVIGKAFRKLEKSGMSEHSVNYKVTKTFIIKKVKN